MSESRLIITPKTRVGELLEAYPELEEVLMSMSPAFEKLKNPVLRRTVARVATLQQVSIVGGLKVDDLVNRLRKEAGQSPADTSAETGAYKPAEIPSWLDMSKITLTYDATPVINAGESPMNEILRLSNQLDKGEIFQLQTPFIPAPVVDKLKSRNFRVFTMEKGAIVLTYICKDKG